jgi:hypothetical protein
MFFVSDPPHPSNPRCAEGASWFSVLAFGFWLLAFGFWLLAFWRLARGA